MHKMKLTQTEHEASAQRVLYKFKFPKISSEQIKFL